MVFTSTLAHFNYTLWGYYLPVSAAQATPFIAGEDRRVICTLNDHYCLHAALMPREGDFFILVNKEIRDKLGLSVGDSVQVALAKDQSEYGMPMPEELLVMLQQDPEADRWFHALTPGKQRSLIYLVSKVKSIDSRIAKAFAIVTHLKEAKGKLDFKALNMWIKHYNQRKGER